MKNGLYFENNELIYYVDDEPKHAGVVEVDGAIYYISSGGRAIKGQHVVHGEMTNGLLKRGTYTFGDDYKLVKGSYIAPRKKSAARKSRSRSNDGPTRFKKKLTKALKKKRNLAAIGCVFLLVLLLVGIGYNEHSKERDEAEAATNQSQTVKVVLPSFDEDVLLCSQAAKKEFDGEVSLSEAIKAGDPYRSFVFEYTIENASGHLYLSEHADLADAQVYELLESSNYVKIDNLKVDTTYYYSVVVADEEYAGSFRTASSNRFVYIPGLVNTRDIGGYTTIDGKKVKQGLLIRGVEMDGLVNAAYYLPDKELDNVQAEFGFVYDMDLRWSTIYNGQYTPRLDISHSFYGAPQYGEIFSPASRDSLRRIFTDLADENKYPMYLHCTWGQDRTGTIVFLLQGILNVSEEDMIREYRLTGYTNPSIAENTNMDVIINGLAQYEGDTLQEKIVTFLTTDIGVTNDAINEIREIFIEG